jgi:cell division protease FtsH
LMRRMVCDFGMTEELGPMSYGEKNEQIFLGREFNQHRDYSEKTAQEIDAIMRRMVDEQYGRARQILTEHREELQRLAMALIEHQLLDLEEVTKVIKGERLEHVKKTLIPAPREQAGGAGASAPAGVVSPAPATSQAGPSGGA